MAAWKQAHAQFRPDLSQNLTIPGSATYIHRMIKACPLSNTAQRNHLANLAEYVRAGEVEAAIALQTSCTAAAWRVPALLEPVTIYFQKCPQRRSVFRCRS